MTIDTLYSLCYLVYIYSLLDVYSQRWSLNIIIHHACSTFVFKLSIRDTLHEPLRQECASCICLCLKRYLVCFHWFQCPFRVWCLFSVLSQIYIYIYVYSIYIERRYFWVLTINCWNFRCATNFR